MSNGKNAILMSTSKSKVKRNKLSSTKSSTSTSLSPQMSKRKKHLSQHEIEFVDGISDQKVRDN